MTSEHEDVIIFNRIDNLEKWSDQNKKSNENQLKNSNVEELKTISLQSEFRDRAYQDH